MLDQQMMLSCHWLQHPFFAGLEQAQPPVALNFMPKYETARQQSANRKRSNEGCQADQRSSSLKETFVDAKRACTGLDEQKGSVVVQARSCQVSYSSYINLLSKYVIGQSQGAHVAAGLLLCIITCIYNIQESVRLSVYSNAFATIWERVFKWTFWLQPGLSWTMCKHGGPH